MNSPAIRLHGPRAVRCRSQPLDTALAERDAHFLRLVGEHLADAAGIEGARLLLDQYCCLVSGRQRRFDFAQCLSLHDLDGHLTVPPHPPSKL